MNQPIWREVVKDREVSARPEGGLWTVVIEYVTGPRKLKIGARGHWALSASQRCGPDGDEMASGGVSGCLSDAAPRGCLIAKVGGGTADLKARVHAIGRFAIIELPDPGEASGATSPRGAFFLTMNDEPSAFQRHEGMLIVDIWEAS